MEDCNCGFLGPCNPGTPQNWNPAALDLWNSETFSGSLVLAVKPDNIVHWIPSNFTCNILKLKFLGLS